VRLVVDHMGATVLHGPLRENILRKKKKPTFSLPKETIPVRKGLTGALLTKDKDACSKNPSRKSQPRTGGEKKGLCSTGAARLDEQRVPREEHEWG